MSGVSGGDDLGSLTDRRGLSVRWSPGRLARWLLVPFAALVATLVLSGCDPVELGVFADSNVLTSVSDDGRFVLIGTQNADLGDSGGASLVLVDRDVDGSGHLDVPDNTSTTVLFGSGGTVQIEDSDLRSKIDGASLFSPAISPDGSVIAFEAYKPGLDNTTDCLYYIELADLGVEDPTLVPNSCPGLSQGGAIPSSVIKPDLMDPVISADNSTIVYAVNQQVDTWVIGWVVRAFDIASGSDEEVSLTDSGSVPYPPASGETWGTASSPSVSADGRFVAFQSSWQLTADARAANGGVNPPSQVYVHDRALDSTVDIPGAAAGYYGSAAGSSISPDGRFVSFVAASGGLDASNPPAGDRNRAYVVDRDVSGSGAFDSPANMSISAVSDGTANVWWTHMADSVSDGSGGVFHGPVAWSELVPTAQTQASLNGSTGEQPVPGVLPGGPVTIPPADRHPQTERGTGATTSSTTTTVAPPTSESAPTSTIAPASIEDVDRPGGGLYPVSLAADLPGSVSMDAAGPSVFGGTLVRINVADPVTGQISETIASGVRNPQSSHGADPFGTRFGFSRDGTSISYGVTTPAQTSYAMARVIDYPWVTDPASTFGFQPYAAYAVDPVNVGTGSFTHATTDLKSPQGVFGLDFVRTYNSADPTSLQLGLGWSSSYTSSVTSHEPPWV